MTYSYKHLLTLLAYGSICYADTASLFNYDTDKTLKAIQGDMLQAVNPALNLMGAVEAEASLPTHGANCYANSIDVSNNPYFDSVSVANDTKGRINIKFEELEVNEQNAYLQLVFFPEDSGGNDLDCSTAHHGITWSCSAYFWKDNPFCKDSTFYGLPYPLSLCRLGTTTPCPT